MGGGGGGLKVCKPVSNLHEHVQVGESTHSRVLNMRHGLVRDPPDALPVVEDVVAHPPRVAQRRRPEAKNVSHYPLSFFPLFT